MRTRRSVAPVACSARRSTRRRQDASGRRRRDRLRSRGRAGRRPAAPGAAPKSPACARSSRQRDLGEQVVAATARRRAGPGRPGRSRPRRRRRSYRGRHRPAATRRRARPASAPAGGGRRACRWRAGSRAPRRRRPPGGSGRRRTAGRSRPAPRPRSGGRPPLRPGRTSGGRAGSVRRARSQPTWSPACSGQLDEGGAGQQDRVRRRRWSASQGQEWISRESRPVRTSAVASATSTAAPSSGCAGGRQPSSPGVAASTVGDRASSARAGRRRSAGRPRRGAAGSVANQLFQSTGDTRA